MLLPIALYLCQTLFFGNFFWVILQLRKWWAKNAHVTWD